MRHSIGADDAKFTTKLSRAALGLSLTPRVKDAIDLCASINRDDTDGLLLDCSQDLQRKPWSKASMMTFTRSSEVFSYSLQRALIGCEYLRILGFPAGTPKMSLPDGVSDAQCKDLAGDAMALPCVTVVELGALIAWRTRK